MPRENGHISNGPLAPRNSQPFLTEAQRAALDAALAAKTTGLAKTYSGLARANSHHEDSTPLKLARSSSLHHHDHARAKAPHHDPGHDKHKGARARAARAKKGGAGGKFTWGGVLSGLEEGAASLDRNDPNYDSADEAHAIAYHSHHATQIALYKQAVVALISEYFNSGDLHEAALGLQELDEPEYMHFFVKKAVTQGLDKHNREREMTSALLSALYNETLAAGPASSMQHMASEQTLSPKHAPGHAKSGYPCTGSEVAGESGLTSSLKEACARVGPQYKVISPEQMAKGFTALVAAADDLRLDVPGADGLIATFIARAVCDDVLPPAFVARMPEACAVRRKAEADLAGRHAAERLARCWGVGAGLVFEETRASVRAMLQEFLASHDEGEAARCLRALAVPFFHHEAVKQALGLALDDPGNVEPLLGLLHSLASTGLISASQLAKGFQRVADALPDTALDNPAAGPRFRDLQARAVAEGWLDMPTERGSGSGDRAAAAAAAAGSTSATARGLQAFKVAAISAVREFYASADAGEVAAQLRDLGQPGLHHILVKQAIQLAMERKDREREMTSQLLTHLQTSGAVAPDQFAQAFVRLLACVEDLALDSPDAAHLLALFLGRAIVDEVLPPSALAAALPSLRNASLGVAVVKATGAMLGARHAAERLQNCWHGGGRTVEQLRDSMQARPRTAAGPALLREYAVSADGEEAARCLRELGVPYFHHELVKKALEVACEVGPQAPAILDLLASFAASGEINQTQMCKGFARLEEALPDLELDLPRAREQFATFQAHARRQGWLAPPPVLPAA